MNHNKYVTRSVLGLVLCLSMLLSACQSPTPVATVAIATNSPPAPKTGVEPSVSVDDQMSDGKSVVVRDVVSQGPGWLAIHDQNPDGSVGEAIGHAAVHDGDNRNVVVTLDPSQVTAVMYAMLHTDAGTVGQYEFPGPDEPVFVNGVMITPPFKWSLGTASVSTPSVVVDNQDVKSGVVMVTKVVSNGPGWLVIQTKNPDGSLGKVIGFAPVQDGESQNVSVTIDPTNIPDSLIAVLYVDAGEVGTFEGSGPDIPVMVGDQAIASTFSTTATAMNMGSPTVTTTVGGYGQAVATPTAAAATETANNSNPGMVMDTSGNADQSMIEVGNQTIISDTVVISTVVSSNPGWVVVYSDDHNQPGEPIGYTGVDAGTSKYVVVHIDSSKVTPTLYAQLHVDQGQTGTFEFPGPDAPVMVGVKMIQGVFNVSGSLVAQPTPAYVEQMVKVSDQEIRGSTVRIDEVHSKGPGWIGIHIFQPDGSLGPPIGDGHVEDGVTQNLIIKIKANLATPQMVAMLHYDAGTVGSWEFPGPDVPVDGDMNVVMPTFNVTGGMPTDPTVLMLGQFNGSSIITDGAGYTLYTSLNDSSGKSNCDDTCRLTWLPVLVNVKLSVKDGVAANKLGLITLPDGSRQVTYSGYPLYYYYADTKPGDAGGQGLDGAWFASLP